MASRSPQEIAKVVQMDQAKTWASEEEVHCEEEAEATLD
jgi:hypothetical protein